MNEEIKLLPTGDFELSKIHEDLELMIKDAMMIPAPMAARNWLKHLPGIQASDFDCPLCDAGVPLSDCNKHFPLRAQPQQQQDPLEDIMWAIVKLNEGKEYFLKKLNDDGTREWTLDNTTCRLWNLQEIAEQFIIDNIGAGQAGVRGLMVDG